MVLIPRSFEEWYKRFSKEEKVWISITFAPIFLPFILRKRRMQKAISFLILPIFNSGVILRATIGLLNFSHWASLSGFLIIATILIIVVKILSK
jgi:hypothetical protein